MDRALLQRHLDQAERHATLGAKHLTRQREIVAALRRCGADTTLALGLLRTMEASQALHIEDRDRLRNMLG